MGYIRALSDPEFPIMPLTKELQELYPYDEHPEFYQFGLIGLGPNIPHVAEDAGDVWLQAHNLMALGMNPRYALSFAMATKRRETFSSPELEAACPRWAGDLTPLMRSFILQAINELGPESVFERDGRRNVGRFYVVMPIALISLFLIPLGTILDILPFIGISGLFLLIGILFNQILTLNGLGTTMRAVTGTPFSSRKNVIKGLAGMVIAGAIGYFISGIGLGIGLAFLGFFLGSSFLGFTRWLSERPRDIILFAHRFGMEALAQFDSYSGMGFIFAPSGAGGGYNKSEVAKTFWDVPI